MPVCPPPAEAIVGTFSAGTRIVGVARTDATVGVGVTGKTTLALWYEYLCTAALGLSGELPAVSVSLDITVTVTAAGLGLTGSLPAVYLSDTLVTPPAALALAAANPAIDTGYPVPAGGLQLGGHAITYALSTSAAPAPAGLGLSVDAPIFAGQTWLTPEQCLGSPSPAICGIAICGLVVCGGVSFMAEAVCISSPDAAIVNTFLCAQRLVGGVPFMTPEPAPLTLTLQTLECR